MFSSPLESKLSKKIIFIVFGWFIFVCLLNLFSLRPLWLDEKFVFLNLKTLPSQAVFGPLLENQVFPRLYLFCIQKVTEVFNYHLVSLRILPFLFMTAAFFIWFKIYKKEQLSKTKQLLLILSWSASYYLVYYAAELKQYSADVFVGAVFTFFLYRQDEILEDKKPFKKLYLLLPVLLLFSYVGFLFAWIPLYNFAILIKKNKKSLSLGIYYLLSLLFFSFLAYYFDIRFCARGAVHAYWKDYFVSFDSLGAFFKSTTEGINNLMSCWFSEARLIKRIARFFAVFGLYSILYSFISRFRKEKFKATSVDIVAFILFAELFLLGVFQIYPFTGERVTIFFAPFVLFAMLQGIYLLEKASRVLFKSIFVAYVSFLVFNTFYLLIYFWRL